MYYVDSNRQSKSGVAVLNSVRSSAFLHSFIIEGLETAVLPRHKDYYIFTINNIFGTLCPLIGYAPHPCIHRLSRIFAELPEMGGA